MANDLRLGVLLSAKDELTRPLGTAGRSVQGLTGKITALSTGFLALRQVTQDALRAITAASREFIDVGDSLGKMSLRLGVAVEDLDALSFVAERQGVSFQNMTVGLQQMTRNLQDAGRGIGEAKDALEVLGFTTADVARLVQQDIAGQFSTLADAISSLGDESTQVAVAMDIFGRSGAMLNQIFAASPGTVAALTERAKELGVVTTDLADRAQTAADRMTDLERGARNAKIAIGDEFLKAITADDVTRIIKLAAAVGKLAGALVAVTGRNVTGAPFKDLFGGLFKRPGDFAGFTSREVFDALGRPRPNVSLLEGGLRHRGPTGLPVGRVSPNARADRIFGELSGEDSRIIVDVLEGMVETSDKIQPILDYHEVVAETAPKFRTASSALEDHIALTRRLNVEFGANVVDAAFRAVDSWSMFAANAILTGQNVFSSLTQAMRRFANDAIALLLRRAGRNILASLFPQNGGSDGVNALGIIGGAAAGFAQGGPLGAVAGGLLGLFGGGGGGDDAQLARTGRGVSPALTVEFNSMFPPTRGQMDQAARVIAGVMRERRAF